jgi:hypothetical protein
MPIDILQLAGNLIVAAGGAWIGSRVSVSHALERLRNERAFDRRLVWYEETVLETIAVRDACSAYASATRHDISKLGMLAGQMEPLFQTFVEKANKAVFYAPVRTVRMLDELQKKLLDFALETSKTLEKRQLHEEFASNVDSLVLVFNGLIFDLAQELRKEQALDTIELSEVQKAAHGK